MNKVRQQTVLLLVMCMSDGRGRRMKLVEIHIHGKYEIEIEDNADIGDEVEQSFINLLDYDPEFEIESYEEVER